MTDIDGDASVDIVTVHADDPAVVRWLPAKALAAGGDLSAAEQVVELGADPGSSARGAVSGRLDTDIYGDVLVFGGGRGVLVSGHPTRPTVDSPIALPSDLWGVGPRPFRANHIVLGVDDDGKPSKLDLLGAATAPVSVGISKPVDEADTVYVGDVDGDGLPDLVGRKGSTITVVHDVLGTSSGSSASVDADILGSTLADADGDGRDDLVLWDRSGKLSLIRWLRDTTAQHTELADVHGQVTGVAVHDLDRNGLPDLAVATSAGPTSVLLADCSCDTGWTGSQCTDCADGDCSAVGGHEQRLWVSVPRRLRGPVGEAARRMAEIAAPGQALSMGTIVRLQEFATTALEAEVVAVVEAGVFEPRVTARPGAPAQVEAAADVIAVVRGEPGASTLTLLAPDAGARTSESPSPPPPGVRTLTTMVRHDDGWQLSHARATWRVTTDDHVEIGKLRVPLARIKSVLSDVMETAP